MGIYLNPGIENFKSMVSGDIYVDKTIAGNMLAAYYSKGCDSAELFASYKIAASPVFDQYMSFLNGLFKSETLRPV